MQPVRVGLIGCGTISAAYLQAARHFPEIAMVACADLDEARARATATRFGLHATGVDALLADPSIELVLNLTVPQAHVPVGLAALAAGKHVHSEKPLAVEPGEGRRLVLAAEAAGLRLGCAPDTFLGGAHQTARKLVDDGAIGRPVAGTAFMMNHGHEHWHPDPGFYYRAGGGPMLDMGPYYVTNLVNLLGPVSRVLGHASRGASQREVTSEPQRGRMLPVEVATHVTGVLEFVAGAVVTITTSFDVWRHGHGNMELYGTEGSLVVPDPNRFGGAVRLAQGRKDWADMPHTHGFGDGDWRILGLVDLARALRQGRPHRCDGRLALHVLEVLAAFQQSSDLGQAVTIEAACGRPAPLPPRTEPGRLD